MEKKDYPSLKEFLPFISNLDQVKEDNSMNNMFGNLIESPNTNSENIYIKTEGEEEEDSFFIKKKNQIWNLKRKLI